MKKTIMVLVICICYTCIIGCNSYVPEGYYISNNDFSNIQQIEEDNTEVIDGEIEFVSASEIELNGVLYDMSEDYYSIGTKMQNNGIVLYCLGGLELYAYDENMQVDSSEAIDIETYSVRLMTVRSENVSLCCDWFSIGNSYNSYKTAQNIGEDAGIHAIDNLDYYVETPDYYSALCIDGQLIDFNRYENLHYVSWAHDVNESGYSNAQEKYFYGLYSEDTQRILFSPVPMFSADFLKFCGDLDELRETYDTEGRNHKEEIAFAFAIMDAYEMLLNDDIDTYTIIRYHIEDDDSISSVEYFTFYNNIE